MGQVLTVLAALLLYGAGTTGSRVRLPYTSGPFVSLPDLFRQLRTVYHSMSVLVRVVLLASLQQGSKSKQS